MASIIQPAFSAGEIADSTWGRIDLGKYQIGLARGRNVVIEVHGGAANRPGTQFICPTKDYSRASRAIEFEFSDTQTYALIFSHLSLRIVTQGGVILESAKAIESITNTFPVAVQITAHGFSSGDEVFITDAGGVTQLEGRWWKVAVTGPDAFTLEDHFGNGADGNTMDPYVSGGSLARVFELVTPYDESHLFQLRYEQELDVVTIVHPSYEPRELKRLAQDNWTLELFQDGATWATPQNLSPSPAGSEYEYVVTAVDPDGVEESLPSSAVQSVKPGVDVTLTWDAVVGSSYYNVYGRSVGGGSYGWIGSSEETTYVYSSNMPEPDWTDTPQSAQAVFDAPGDYPGAITYFDQRLVLARSDNKPTTMWGSNVGAYTNFNRAVATLRDTDSFTFTLAGRSLNAIQHLVPLDNLIVLTTGAEWVARGTQGDGVLAPNSSPGLRPRTYNGASFVRPIVVNDSMLYVQRGTSVVRDFQYQLEADNFAGDDLMVLAPHLVDGYGLVDSAWHQSPYRIAWFVRDDGQMLALAYMREHDIWAWSTLDTWEGEFESVCTVSEGEEDVAYVTVRRTVGGQSVRYVERIGSRDMRAPGGSVTDQRFARFSDCNALYYRPQSVVSLTSASPATLTVTAHGWSENDEIELRDIEGVTADPRDTDTLAAAVNGKRFQVRNVTPNTVDLYEHKDPWDPFDTTPYLAHKVNTGTACKAVNQISGLWHLEGEKVAVLGDANVLTNGWTDPVFGDPIPITVTNGAITMLSNHCVVSVGLPTEAILETLPMPRDQGGRKQTSGLVVRTKDSRGLWIGPDYEHMFEWKQRYEETWDSPIELFTGDTYLNLDTRWELTAQLTMAQRDPLPMHVLAVVPDVESGH